MKKLDLGQAISILANIGVIAGIVFLGLELRQNNELMRSEASLAQFNVDMERRRMLMDDPELIDIMSRARAGESLTETEEIRLGLFTNTMLDAYRWQFREYQAGRMPDDYLDLRMWHDVWSYQPRLKQQFEMDRSRLEPEFVKFVDEQVLAVIE